MEDGVLSPATMLGVPSDSAMDLDFMDEIFLQGCWLETREGSEFLNQTTTNPLFDPLFSNSNFDTANNGQLNNNTTTTTTTKKKPSQKASQEHQLADVGAYCGSDWGGGLEAKGSTELSRSLWIGPSRINVEDGSSSTVVDKLCRALMSIKDVIRDKSVLVQIWVPVNNRDGRRVLTTRDLPFAIDDSCQKLARYRDISVKYQFLVDDGEEVESSKELLKGLPGRVFSGKVPEWTPDVRFFRKDEYPRLRHAQLYDVRGTLALPVFEQGSKTCLGVIEVVTTTQNIKYRPELESVCKALEAFDLKSSEVLKAQNVYSKYYQAALPEIQDVLRSACKTHGLPLAQTWVPCVYQGKEGCRHSDENFIQCVSTVDHACYVADPRIQGFHEACSEHHLFKGQGIVGSAFMTNQPCFSADITSYAKTEYPLSHHAMVFGLHAAVAIRLRSIQTGVADFVLEFFLPVDCTNPEEQMKMLTSLSLIIQQCCCTLRVVTDKELEEEESELRVLKVVAPPSNAAIPNNAALLVDVQQNGALDVPLFKKEKLREASALSLNLHQQRDLSLKPSVGCVEECSTIGEGSFSSVGISKTGERRRTKAEKTITLQVLRQYFAGSLKDAAKSIGVCSTTLKRICRQHGIKRWPSRKIKKVGHSLQKLQLVIDSVQGASGAFQIDSFYSNFPELASPNVSGTCPFSASKPGHNHPKPSNMQPEGGVFGVQANATTSKSSSSCSQSSSSSQCCTSRSQQQQYPAAVTTWNVTSSGEDQVAGKNSDGIVLKRVRSEAGLNSMCNEDDTTTKITMPRSQSQRSLLEHQRTRKFSTSTNNNPPVLKSSGRPSQEGEFQRVKVTFGDEKTRFRMHNNRGFGDLQREIARRFGIEDMGVYTIKYLDDDSEWVLLTCEADLEECFEVCRTSQTNTIKLSLQVSRHVSRGCLGSNGPP